MKKNWKYMVLTYFVCLMLFFAINTVTYADASNTGRFSSMTPEQFERLKVESIYRCVKGLMHDHSICLYNDRNPCYANNGVNWTCEKCSWLCYEVCNRDGMYDGTRKHKNGSCTITYLQSTASYICGGCGRRTTIMAPSPYSGAAKHDCWQIHDSCSVGQYKVCPF